MKYAKIIASGSYLPEKILTNQDLEKIVETNNNWIIERTGIQQRHIIDQKQTTSDMAYIAATNALKMANLDPAKIGLIIVATSTPDATFPSTACILQNKLGIKNNCPAFDLAAACSGFLYALTTADYYIKSGMIEYALIVGVDALSPIVDYTDRGTCILFGDGAGAVILKKSDTPGILGNKLAADGEYGPILSCGGRSYYGQIKDNPYIHMDGQAVYKFAIKSLTAISHDLAAQCGVSLNEVNWLIPHQANLRIMEAVTEKLGLTRDKLISSVAEHANTSAASVPLALDLAIRDGRVKAGDLLLLAAVGAGFTWGASLVRY